MNSPYRSDAQLCTVCSKPIFGGVGFSHRYYKDGKYVSFALVQHGKAPGAKSVVNEPVCSFACEDEWFKQYERAMGFSS